MAKIRRVDGTEVAVDELMEAEVTTAAEAIYGAGDGDLREAAEAEVHVKQGYQTHSRAGLRLMVHLYAEAHEARHGRLFVAKSLASEEDINAAHQAGAL